ncbi:hypothetical protein [Mycobacterium sp. 050134]|uniref:hypothetical protein n=1 Tax=Mycobacterium sp. 050134 TaxID=3096111 RepID=UPI002EDB9819
MFVSVALENLRHVGKLFGYRFGGFARIVGYEECVEVTVPIQDCGIFKPVATAVFARHQTLEA